MPATPTSRAEPSATTDKRAHGQSYNALQQQFNSMQYSRHPLQHFPTDIPSSSTGDPTVRTLQLHMQHQPQGLIVQRNNNCNEGHLQLSNDQMNSGGHVFQPHQHHPQLEQTRFTHQGNDHQDHCQLLEIRDSTTQEKEVYEIHQASVNMIGNELVLPLTVMF